VALKKAPIIKLETIRQNTMAIDSQSPTSSTQLEMTRNVHDVNSTAVLKQKSREGGDEVLREVAQQFEAIFMRMLLKTMRQAQDTLSDKDNPLNSDQMKFYRDMHDQQLAVNLSSNGSLGLADVIVQQLSGPTNTRFVNSPQINTISGEEGVLNAAQNISAKPTNNEEKRSSFNTPQDFIEYLLPKVQPAAEKLGIDAKALVAQSALETGWGKFIMHDKDGKSAHNLFGIKADTRWAGEKVVVNTMENEGGVASQIRAAFRSYDNFSDSVNDYVDFLKSNSRYADALDKTENVKGFFQALQDAGYATDPDYANKVISIYKGDTLNGRNSGVNIGIMR